MKKNILFILDPAHGRDVAGKCSPNGWIKEWSYSRDFIKDLMKEMGLRDLSVMNPIRQEEEPGLSARRNLYNAIQTDGDKFVISIHLNAAGSGSGWMDARGWEIFTSRGHTRSDEMATVIFNQVKSDFPEMKMRPGYWDPAESKNDPDKEANFTVLTGSRYYACLIELGFMDNRDDLCMLINPAWRSEMIRSIATACQDIKKQYDEK